MKKLVIITVLSMICLGVQAYDFCVDGLYYRIIDQANKKVAVTQGDMKARGSITIPETVNNGDLIYEVTQIDGETFYNCEDITSLNISNSVTMIGAYLCCNCIALKSVTIGNGLKEISRFAFYGCSDLERVTFGSKIETIGESAFGYCKNLSSILINDNLVTIGESAFEFCSSLTSFTIGSRVRLLSKWAFRECQNLSDVKINNGITTIGDEAFESCVELENVSIPNSVLEMGSYVFKNCKSLSNVKIGNGVVTIPRYAFADCERLQTVILGSGIQRLNECVFNDCKALASLTILNPTPPTMYPESDSWHYPFYNQNAIIYIPQQSMSAYRADSEWGKFAKIEPYEGIVYLTIRQGEGGNLKEQVNVGENYRYTIVPDEDWQIHYVTFNGIDVTKQLIDNSYTTPALTENAVLSVVFEKISDDVKAASARKVMVRTEGNTIIVNGVISGEVVSVYSADGVLRFQTISNGTELQIPTNNKTGIYIVKTPEKTVKLAL